MKVITEKQLSEQNSLTKDRLAKLTPTKNFLPKNKRPVSSLIELINWATEEFCEKQPHEYGSYIHNKMVIDGGFLQFCEEKKIEIECLLKDSIASWKTEHGTEQFIAQGVYK